MTRVLVSKETIKLENGMNINNNATPCTITDAK
jgi:hypothetical protein